MADEYVDFSCSTPIERLTRDIETVLRSWHIQQTDRHISHYGSGRHQTTLKSSEIPRNISFGKTSEEENEISQSTGDVKLIRSTKITFTTNPPNSDSSQNKIDIELDLALWDGPPSICKSNVDASTKLPLSLSSNCRDPFPEGNILSNFSCLFAIAQHLTLSPSSNEIIESMLKDTIEALEASTITKMSKFGRNRVDDLVTVRCIAICSLSDQLQTALNVATASCDCRIPAFGIWGDYYQSVLRSDVRTQRKRNKGDSLSMSVMEVPSWMNTMGIFNIASDSSVCSMFRKHIEQSRHENGEIIDEDTHDLQMDDSSHLSSSPSRVQQSARHRGHIQQPMHLTPTRNTARQKNRESFYISQYLIGSCNPGVSYFAAGAKFSIHVVPPGIPYPLHCSTLNSLGRLLLPNCPVIKQGKKSKNRKFKDSEPVFNKVVVTGARHKYTWSKIFQRELDIIPHQDELILWFDNNQKSWDELNIFSFGISWRKSCDRAIEDVEAFSVLNYRKGCKEHALKLLYKVSCFSRPIRSRARLVSTKSLEPAWGPYSDPLLLLSVESTWSGHKQENHQAHESHMPSSLLALPLRIRSKQTLSSQDVLDMESTILSSTFNPILVPAPNFKVNISYHHDIGCATLSSTVRCLLASLIRVSALENSCLLGHLSKVSILEQLHQREELDILTKQVMDQTGVSLTTRKLVEAIDWYSMANILDETTDERMNNIIESILLLPEYPSPPQDAFDDESLMEGDTPLHFLNSCRPGRLLSILFTSMANMQVPSCMASLWMAFVGNLRLRWENREALPNLGTIPGLDGLNFSQQEEAPGHNSPPIKKLKQNHTFSGDVDRLNTAFVNSSGSDPCLNECIINQKLTVFNIGVEANIFEEMKFMEREEAQSVPQSVCNANGFDLNIRDTVDGDDFYDALDGDPCGSDESHHPYQRPRDSTRSGARCPVEGKRLMASKEQLYAPYLQRDVPLTDDLILERKKMLTSTGVSDKTTIQSRIEAAHRLQKKKLVSDMSAFKAANPGAIFQDFINWYGNPGNPLDKYEYGSSSVDVALQSKSAEEEAAEAMLILSATRTFWSNCWDESKPLSAREQPALFDAFSTIEILLHWLEAIHPAVLINQILAVNLTNAIFVLQSSMPNRTPPIVQNVLSKLKDKTNITLGLLKHDVAKSITMSTIRSPLLDDDVHDPFAYVSPETIASCEEVCSIMGDAETIMSRAASLLTKLDGDVELVQQLLESPEGKSVEVKNHRSRTQILHEIMSQELRNNGKGDIENDRELPSPSLREYILRNIDENNPCQLTVSIGGTFGLEDGGSNSTKGGLVMALKKCVR